MKRVAIVGAGPVGLAAAAHVLERGMVPIVLEAGPEVGHAVRQWGHVRMFSPWTYNVDRAAGRLLEKAGWNRPDGDAYLTQPRGRLLACPRPRPPSPRKASRTWRRGSRRRA